MQPISGNFGIVQPATASALSAAARGLAPAGPSDQYTPTLNDKFVSGAKGASLGAAALGVTGAGLGTYLALLSGDVPVLAAAVPIGVVGALWGAGIGGYRGVQKAEHGTPGDKTPTVHEKLVSGAKCAALGAGVAATCFMMLGAVLATGMYNVPTGELLKGMGVATSLFGGLGAGMGFDHGWNHVGWDHTAQ